jgi:hypothetical protein
MDAPKGNLNALKHGLYAKHFTPDFLPELKKMPVDDVKMELNAIRLLAARALDLCYTTTDEDRQTKLFQVCLSALKTIVNAVGKSQLICADTPVLQQLWDAIEEANQIEKIPFDL